MDYKNGVIEQSNSPYVASTYRGKPVSFGQSSGTYVYTGINLTHGVNIYAVGFYVVNPTIVTFNVSVGYGVAGSGDFTPDPIVYAEINTLDSAAGANLTPSGTTPEYYFVSKSGAQASTISATLKPGYYVFAVVPKTPPVSNQAFQFDVTADGLPLFTPGTETVNFNSLTAGQQSSIRSYPSSIYNGLGGDDVVTLPSAANFNESIGGGDTLNWSSRTPFVTGSKVGDTYTINGTDGSYDIQLGAGADNVTIDGNGSSTIEAGSYDDTITITGNGGNTIVGGTGKASVSINGSGANVFKGALRGSASIAGGGSLDVTGALPGPATIGSDSTLEVSGASSTGTINFAAGATKATLKIDGSSVPKAVISGLTSDDTIDLAGVTANECYYDAAHSLLTLYEVKPSTGRVRLEPYNAPQKVGTINLAATAPSGYSFNLASDGRSGTVVTIARPNNHYQVEFGFSQSIDSAGHLQAGTLTCQIYQSGVSKPIWSWTGTASQDDVFPLRKGAVSVSSQSWSKSPNNLGLVLNINNLAGSTHQTKVEFHIGNAPPVGGPIDGQWSNQSESCLVASGYGFFTPFEQVISLLAGLNPSSVTTDNVDIPALAAYLNGESSSVNGSSATWAFDVFENSVTQATLGVADSVSATIKDSTFDFTVTRPLEKLIKILYSVVEMGVKNNVIDATTREAFIVPEKKSTSNISIATLGSGQTIAHDPSIIKPANDQNYYKNDYYAALPELAGDTYTVLLDGYQAWYNSTSKQEWYYDSNNSSGNLGAETLMFNKNEMSLKIV